MIKGNDTAYVSSVRDREVIAIDISSKTEGRLIQRIRLDGSGLGMALDKSGARLFVAQDNADQVAVIDTASNTVTARIDACAPEGLLAGAERGRKLEKGRHGQGGDGERYTGAGTFAVTLAPDGKTLYAVNAGANSIAVIPLEGRSGYHVSGLIPTAYEPHDITFSADGKWMYIINGKDITGPNPEQLTGYTGSSEALGGPDAALAARAANQYQFQLERSSLVSARVPGPEQLERLTKREHACAGSRWRRALPCSPSAARAGQTPNDRAPSSAAASAPTSSWRRRAAPRHSGPSTATVR